MGLPKVGDAGEHCQRSSLSTLWPPPFAFIGCALDSSTPLWPHETSPTTTQLSGMQGLYVYSCVPKTQQHAWPRVICNTCFWVCLFVCFLKKKKHLLLGYSSMISLNFESKNHLLKTTVSKEENLFSAMFWGLLWSQDKHVFCNSKQAGYMDVQIYTCMHTYTPHI